MNDASFAAVLSLLGSLAGTLGGILATAKLTNYRLSQLEKKMDEMGLLVGRVCELEQKTAIHEERFHIRPGARGCEIPYAN